MSFPFMPWSATTIYMLGDIVRIDGVLHRLQKVMTTDGAWIQAFVEIEEYR